MLPLVLPVVLNHLSLCFPSLSSPETPNPFVRLQLADRVKLTEALLILLMSWLKKLKQQRTTNSFLV